MPFPGGALAFAAHDDWLPTLGPGGIKRDFARRISMGRDCSLATLVVIARRQRRW